MFNRYSIKRLEYFYQSRNCRKIIKCLNNGDYVVRQKSATYLGAIGGKDVVEDLFRHLEDPVGLVRIAVAEAILKIDDSSRNQKRIDDSKKKLEQLKKKKREFSKKRNSEAVSFKEKMVWTKTVKEMLKKPMRW